MQALVKISKPQWFIVGRNLKTAKALGLAVPYSLLARADEAGQAKLSRTKSHLMVTVRLPL